MSVDAVPVRRLIFWPSVVTLAVTLLRLTGELLHWSPALFSPAPGGGGSPIGISWLPPVFGVLFAIQLVRAGPGAGQRRARDRAGVPGTGGHGGRDRRVALRSGSSSRASPALLSLVDLHRRHRHRRGHRVVGVAGARAHAARLRVRGPHPRRAGDAHRDDRQLGHALRRRASGVPRDGRVRQVVHDRRASRSSRRGSRSRC